MFSSRTRWDLTPNALSKLSAEVRADGRPFFDLTETNPTRAGLPAPREVLSLLSRPASLDAARSRSHAARASRNPKQTNR